MTTMAMPGNTSSTYLIHLFGKLQTRRWKKEGEDSNHLSTEILVVPGHRLQFLDKPNGNRAHPANGEAASAQIDNSGAEVPV